MNAHDVMDIALTAGEILLGYGAETYRIEDTVIRICNSYGYDAECLTVSKGLWLTIGQGKEKITSVKKVKKQSVDLYRIELVNDFSRKLCKKQLPADEAMKTLNYISNSPTFTYKVRLFASCMTGFIYTLFFNGTMVDGIVSIIICSFTYWILEKISKLGFFEFLQYYVSGLIIGLCSILSHMMIGSINSHNVITGSIMILLPGVILTNGIKDMLYGDFSSGISRFSEALIVIAAVSAGIATALLSLKGM